MGVSGSVSAACTGGVARAQREAALVGAGVRDEVEIGVAGAAVHDADSGGTTAASAGTSESTSSTATPPSRRTEPATVGPDRWGAGWNNQPVQIDDLLRRQADLQSEAAAVRSDLALDTRLSRHGTVMDVGSAALGLMVWRDLDLTVVCQTLDVGSVADTGAGLARHERVREVRFRNDTGGWNTDPRYPDGLYLNLDCRGRTDDQWKVDIWFVDEPERQPDLAHARELPPRLTPETRVAILAIKDAWAQRPEYGNLVTSWDIYRAVLDDGVRTSADFAEWRQRSRRDS